MKRQSTLKPSTIFLLLAILLGGFIRLWPVLSASFPINDGGLFYTMTRDLIENGYRLPTTVSYNGLDLPFAYPPLPFYLAAGLFDLTGADLLDIFRILPAIFSILAIPAFYLLAKDLLENDDQVTLAVFAFALVPPSFDWLVMGGGLTRAPAFLFGILTLRSTYWLYAAKGRWTILWTALFASLTILCHPEAGLHIAAGALVMFLFFGRSKRGLTKSMTVAGLVFAITAPWWGTVLGRHGLTPFMAAGRTSGHDLNSIFALFKFDLTGEYGLKTIGTLALIGLFWQLAKKQAFLPVWVLVNFIVEPRSAALYQAPCIALLAALALGRIFSVFSSGEETFAEETGNLFSQRGVRLAFGVLLAQWLFSAMAIALLEGRLTLSPHDQQAFAWIQENTPAESRFLVLTGNEPMTDPVSEWFPALTERRSLATLQGYEWYSGRDFAEVMAESYAIQACINRAPSCMETWLARNELSADYLFISQNTTPDENALPGVTLLPLTLAASGHYDIVYETDEVVILQVR